MIAGSGFGVGVSAMRLTDCQHFIGCEETISN
jgi:hypothetical protein